MKKIVVLLFVACMLVASQAAFAGTLTGYTGLSSASYHKIFEQIKGVCPEPVLEEKLTNGTPENIDNLNANKANIAMLQEDGLFASLYIDKEEETKNIKVLLPLYDEEVHMIVRADSVMRNFTDLGNKRVAAWGGSIKTAKFLLAKGEVHHDGVIYDPKSKDKAFQWLDGRNVDVIIAVGGQPMDWVASLPKKYRLLEFNAYDKVGKFYKQATLSYPNLGQRGVKTISTGAVLATNDYKSEEKIKDLNILRSCIVKNLDNLAETTGLHPKWKKVREKYEAANGNPKSKWPMYSRIRGIKADSGAKKIPAKAKKGKAQKKEAATEEES